MFIKNGIEYAIDNAELTLVKNELINQLQDKTILWNGESKLLTTVLLEIFEQVSGKANIIIVDGEMPTTNLVANSQYWCSTKDGTVLTSGRYIYITDNLKVVTYVGTSEVDLAQYMKKTDISASETGTSTNEINYLTFNGNEYKIGSMDTVMSDTSENAVENKVIKEYVDTTASNKVDKVTGKDLSTNDYTTADKTKVDILSGSTQELIFTLSDGTTQTVKVVTGV